MNEPDTALSPSSEFTGATVVTVELTLDEINILLYLRGPEYGSLAHRYFVQSDRNTHINARALLNTAFKSCTGEDSPEW